MPLVYRLAFAHRQFTIVRVTRRVTVAVANNQRVAVLRIPPDSITVPPPAASTGVCSGNSKSSPECIATRRFIGSDRSPKPLEILACDGTTGRLSFEKSTIDWSKRDHRVYLIEDDDGLRLQLVATLRDVGLLVHEFAMAEAILAEPLDCGPAVILSDMVLPGLSGLDLLKL